LLEIVALLQPKRIAEVPFTFRTRQFGKSKLSGSIILLYLQQLWRLSGQGAFIERAEEI
jgi:hypothetical protein